MSNVTDLTLEVLEDIRSEMREMRSELRTLTERVENGFASVNGRIDSVIVGTHHHELEARVTRI